MFTKDEKDRCDLISNKIIGCAIEKVLPIHKAQLKTYLKLSNKWLGLLMNFNVEKIKDGIERIVWG
jgi:GxxExxY protein